MSRTTLGQTNMSKQKSPQQLSSSTSYEDIPDPDYTTVPSKCDLCSKVLVGVSRLSKHLARVHKAEIEIKCRVCGESFRRNKAFVQHLRERHVGRQDSVLQDVGKPSSGNKGIKEVLSSAQDPSNIPVANDEDIKLENHDSVWDAEDFSPSLSPPMETETEKVACDTSTSSVRVDIIPNTINKSPVATMVSRSSERVTRSSVKRLATPSCSDGKTNVSNVVNAKQGIKSGPRSKPKTASDIHLSTTVGTSLQGKRKQDLLTKRQRVKQNAALGSLPLTLKTPTPSVMPFSSRVPRQPTTTETLNTSEDKSSTNKPIRSEQRKRKEPISTPLSDAHGNSEAKALKVSEQTISVEKLKACIASVENFYEDEEPCFKFEKRSIDGDEYQQCIIYRVCKISGGVYNCSVCEESSVTELDAKNHFVQAHSELIQNQCSNSPCVLKFANINELVSYQERFRGKEILLGLDRSCRKTSAVVNEALSRDKGNEQEDSRLAQDSFDVPGTPRSEETSSEPDLKDCLWDDDFAFPPAPSPPCSPMEAESGIPTCDISTSAVSLMPVNSIVNELCTEDKTSTIKILEHEKVINPDSLPPAIAKTAAPSAFSSETVPSFKSVGIDPINPIALVSTREVGLDGDETIFEQCSHAEEESHRFVLYKYSKIIDGVRYCTACERPSMSENGARHHFVITHKELLENACSDSPSVLRFASETALKSYRKKYKRSEFLIQPKVKCDECERCFQSRAGRRYHRMAVHSRVPPVSTKCEVCGKMVPSTTLARHIRRVHDSKTGLTTCTICKKSFASSYYWRHMLDKHKNYEKPHKASAPCNICHTMLSPKYRDRHMINVHGQQGTSKRTVDCQVCGESVASAYLKKHMKLRHRPTTTVEPCSQCDRTFATNYSLRKHVFRYHSGRSIQNSCTTCLLDFETTELLEAHKLEKHVCMCEICGLSLKDAHALQRHSKTHLDPKQRKKWQCEICGWTGLCQGGLTQHKRTHLSEKAFQCEFCDYRYNHRTLHITHVFKVHFGPDGFRANEKEQKENTFICQVCMQAYPNEACLQFHLQYHQEEKQFSCDQCSEAFHTKYDLLRHKREAHNVREPRMPMTRMRLSNYNETDCGSIGPDPDTRGWKCLVCDKKFNVKTQARMHWRVKHLNETPFPCTFCGKGYKTKQDLAYHTRAVHTKEAKVVCSVCGLKSYSMSNWRVHMKTHDK